MTRIKRRTRPPEPEPEPTGPRPPKRINEAMREIGKPRFHGVDPESAERALRAYMQADKGEVRPYCTHIIATYCFDPQYGVYVHADPACWKPSKGMFEACLRAGLLGEVVAR